MKVLGCILYWLVAVALVALVLGSLGYNAGQAILIALVFCPCSIALAFLFSKATKARDRVYVTLAVIPFTLLLIMMVHYLLLNDISKGDFWSVPVNSMLENPVFLAGILTLLSLGDHFWRQFLDGRFAASPRPVTFFSDRHNVTLDAREIAYIESNDTEVRIFTRDGRSYRNKTGISQWENLLGKGFVRIHRSYLVNAECSRLDAPDTVVLDSGISLPVSRKYKTSVTEILPTS